MISLVGCTGFVGSNLMKQASFTNAYHSKNISEAYATNPDVLVYAGIRAEKYLANQQPQRDKEHVEEAFQNIKKINPGQLILISTIDVYNDPVMVDEDTLIDTSKLQPYGLNRYYLEKWVEDEYKNAIIVRLPALYGENIKKNFIYDLLTIIPNLLKKDKYSELYHCNPLIADYYKKNNNGFYQCRKLTVAEKQDAKAMFNEIGFTALNFTDSRGIYQFYNLQYLWKHLQIAQRNEIRKLNMAVEPVTIREIYQRIRNTDFYNRCSDQIPNYNMKTKYDFIFDRKHGYLLSKLEVLDDLKQYVLNQERNLL